MPANGGVGARTGYHSPVTGHHPPCPTGYRRLVLAAAALLSLTGCAAAPEQPPARQPMVTPTGPAGATTPVAQTACTQRAANAVTAQTAFNTANPGDVICLTGDMSDLRLRIFRSGTPDAPIHVLGDGKVRTAGMDVDADHVVLDGITADKPRAPGISLHGTGLTLQNSRVNEPKLGDRDAIRFWGRDIKILHNTLSNTRNEDRAHADCMQTYATDRDHPASQNVLIDGNRCEKIDNNCLIVEGPGSSAGDGSGIGETRNITWTNNFCDNRAAQAVLLDDAQGATLTGNAIVGKIHHAFAIQNGSTGVAVSRNKLNPALKFEVGMDESSRRAYRGPEPGGQP